MEQDNQTAYLSKHFAKPYAPVLLPLLCTTSLAAGVGPPIVFKSVLMHRIKSQHMSDFLLNLTSMEYRTN